MKPSLLLFLTLLLLTCPIYSQGLDAVNQGKAKEELRLMLDSISISEQEPIRLRDYYMEKYGVESEQALEQQKIYKVNHVVNENKISSLLDKEGWPPKSLVGEVGNRTICNVLQHSPVDVRIKYLPMMKDAVLTKGLNPQLLVRAEDRLATDRGELQIYGGQMKYYPETKSFNVWPVFAPQNIDKRRAKLGLPPIAQHLKQRFDFEWDLEEQVKRTEQFLASKKSRE